MKLQGSRWLLQRGDFRAEWDSTAGRGHIRQSRNPYAINYLLRIVHTLILAKHGGFLVHAASAIRGGRAFLFAGVYRRGQDHDFPAGAIRCHITQRRNFLRAT